MLRFFNVVNNYIYDKDCVRRNIAGRARNFRDFRKLAFCANDLRPICNRTQCPRFSWFRITTRLPITDRAMPDAGTLLFPLPPPPRSILISRPVSRKLNHCTIGENDGSLCRKFMRCKILATRPRHTEIV